MKIWQCTKSLSKLSVIMFIAISISIIGMLVYPPDLEDNRQAIIPIDRQNIAPKLKIYYNNF